MRAGLPIERERERERERDSLIDDGFCTLVKLSSYLSERSSYSVNIHMLIK